MNARTSSPFRRCPSSVAWAEELQRLDEEPALVDHLERCEHCRQIIDHLAADPGLWKEVGETLAAKPPDMSHLMESICPLSVDQDQEPSELDPLCEHELAQLQRMLPTASHPELLARIGRYEVEQLIGRGGMGLVFRAWDTELHRVVAVKTLSLALMPLGTARERFIREGRAAAMLNHPHIVPMYDVITEPPVPALVMQYIAGPTLESWLSEHGPMQWQEALRVGSQLADALSAAHAEGLVHRDIKPSNVLLEADATRALLTDFGLVRAIDSATLTHSGMLAGTPHFMSPEQARGEEVDCRSDLFSLGSLLYYAMTGHGPFAGREPMAVLNHLCHSTHLPLCRVNRDIPFEVSRLIDRLLSKSTSKRPVSSHAVREEMRELLSAPRRLRRRGAFRTRAPNLQIWAAGGATLILAVVLVYSSTFLNAWKVTRESSNAAPRGAGAANHSSLTALDSESGDPSQVLPNPDLSATSSELSQEHPPGSVGYEFVDFERLARQAAELEASLNAYEAEARGLTSADFTVAPAFDIFSSEAAAIRRELDQLRAIQFDSTSSSSISSSQSTPLP